jgi:hypothetical protein
MGHTRGSAWQEPWPRQAALASADGVVVSAALMLKNEARRGPVIWDIDQYRRFMDAAGG